LNGGIELEIYPISNKSVTGTVLTENYITLNNNGTEANQTHAVIILTDAAKTYFLNVLYQSSLQHQLVLALGIAPFNPFIIANKREKLKSIYLIQNRLLLGDNKIKQQVSRDINGNYLSDEGMPWAISFIDDLG
jgi:hypothetical protein